MPGGESIQEYLSPSEFGKIAGLSLATVHRYLADGRLPKFQPGGKRCRVMIPRSALDTHLVNTDSVPAPMAEFANNEHLLSGAKPRWMQADNQRRNI